VRRLSSAIKVFWAITPSTLSAPTGLMPRESRDALENLPKEAPRQAAVCAIDAWAAENRQAGFRIPRP